MSKINVTCEVKVYPDKSFDNPTPIREPIMVKSCDHFREKIILVIDGKEFTVFSEELEMAIRNAKNAH